MWGDGGGVWKLGSDGSWLDGSSDSASHLTWVERVYFGFPGIQRLHCVDNSIQA